MVLYVHLVFDKCLLNECINDWNLGWGVATPFSEALPIVSEKGEDNLGEVGQVGKE